MKSVRAIMMDNGMLAHEHMSTSKDELSKVAWWIMAEHDWQGDRSWRIFLEQKNKKELSRFISAYWACQKSGLKREVARNILDVVCCCGTDWNKAERDWLREVYE